MSGPDRELLLQLGCTCGGPEPCVACDAWSALAQGIEERAAAETAPQPPLSLPKAAVAVLRLPVNVAKLRSFERAAWVLGYEIQEARQ